jgi:ABC-type transport system substrate-binding protein
MLAALVALETSAAGRGPGVLRVGLPAVPETLDPARSDNAQAVAVMAGIYDTLYALDPLAPTATLVPLAAVALPEVSPDHRVFTIRVKPGISFTPHAAFGGKPRELVAADFAYAMRRVLDPKLHSPSESLLAGKIDGLDALAKRAQDSGRGIDYDAPVPGLVLIDRYTLRITLQAPDPVFRFMLAHPLLAGLAREVVEAEGDTYGHRPVGTGAFVVASFVPGQRLVLVPNPAYRAMHWEDLLTPQSRAASDKHAMRGRKLPGVTRLEFSYTPEAASELMAIRAGELDLVQLGQPELAMRNGRLRDDLAGHDLVILRNPVPVTLVAFLSMRDPVVGGNSQEKIALRRAIHMAFDDGEWIRVLDSGLSSLRHQIVPPGIEGHIAAYRNPNLFDPAAANALLDRFGYRRGADGFRRNTDGSPLTIALLIDTKSQSRRRAEFAQRMLERVGIGVKVETVTPGEQLKRMAACRFGMTWMDWGLDVPDGTNPLIMFYSKSAGAWNFSCLADAEFDAAYEKALTTPPGPARTAAFWTMQSRIDSLGTARPVPFGDIVVLKRRGIEGPFNTASDWLQVMTLTDAGVPANPPQPAARR